MIARQLVVDQPAADDRAEALGDIDVRLAERGEIGRDDAIVGDAAIVAHDRAGIGRAVCRMDVIGQPRSRSGKRRDLADVAAIGLVGLGAERIEAEDVIDQSALGRGQPQLLAQLIEFDRADILALRDADRRQAARQRGEIVLILMLLVAPAAIGADRGDGEVAQFLIGLQRDAVILVLHRADEARIDRAVVEAGDDALRREQRRQRRAGDDHAGREVHPPGGGDHAGRHVVALVEIVGGERHAQRVVGCEQQFAAAAVARVAVDVAVRSDVVHVAAPMAVEPAQQVIELARHDRAGDGRLEAILAALVIARLGMAVVGVGRRLGDDVDHAGGRVLAEQRALRPAQHLDPLDLAQVQRLLAGADQHDAVHHGGDRRFNAGRGGDRADAADEDRAVLVRRAGAEVDRRDDRRDVLQVVEVLSRGRRAVHHADGDRHALQRLGAEARGDDDLAGSEFGLAAGSGGGRCSMSRGRPTSTPAGSPAAGRSV